VAEPTRPELKFGPTTDTRPQRNDV
jgi:hypothetical protein